MEARLPRDTISDAQAKLNATKSLFDISYAAHLEALRRAQPFETPADLLKDLAMFETLRTTVAGRDERTLRALQETPCGLQIEWASQIDTLLKQAITRTRAAQMADTVAYRHTRYWQRVYDAHLVSDEERWTKLERAITAHSQSLRRQQDALKHEHDQLLQAQAFADLVELRTSVEQADRELREAQSTACEQFSRCIKTDFAHTTIETFAPEVDAELKGRLLDIRRNFLRAWCNANGIEPLDEQQLDAMASIGAHAIVTARAGSGKTRTLVSRAAFLVKHCGVAPSQILLLAFNRKAAEEMRSRLQRAGVSCPHAMTFHALAYALVHPEEAIVKDDPDETFGQRSAVMDHVLKDFLLDPVREDAVRNVLVRHFKNDWECLVDNGTALSQKEGLDLRRSLEHEAIDGTRVKSYGEKAIANFLFEHGIAYGYERNHWWGQRNYRPDFTLKRRKLVIEYFGRAGDPEYDRECERKREYWKKRAKNGWKLLEYNPTHLGGDICKILADDLTKLRVPVNRLSDEEIWSQVRSRLRTRFAAIVMNFVSRCRKAMLAPDDVDNLLREHECISDIESDVLSLAADFYRAYLARLSHESKEDFDGLLERAASLVEGGVTRFDRRSGPGDLAAMRYIMIDEYQDFSPLFHKLLSATRARTPYVQVYCVGDDWQAINGFAGSDLRFFCNFAGYFGSSRSHVIATNYRSAASIVEFGNLIMAGHGAPAIVRQGADSGKVLLGDLDKFKATEPETTCWPNDIISPAVRRLLLPALRGGRSIAVLARQRYLPYKVHKSKDFKSSRTDLDQLRSNIIEGLTDAQREQIYVGTVHSYKGKEADIVIIVDAIDRRFPAIHPDWVFGRIFGDTITELVEAERRLFYVACTRPISRLILLTQKLHESPFLEPVLNSCAKLEWLGLEPFCPKGGDWIILVGNVPTDDNGAATKARAELLKEKGYVYYDCEWPYWRKSIPRKYALESIVANLPSAPWLPGPDGLEVRICDSDGSVVERLELSGGRFEKMGD